MWFGGPSAINCGSSCLRSLSLAHQVTNVEKNYVQGTFFFFFFFAKSGWYPRPRLEKYLTKLELQNIDTLQNTTAVVVPAGRCAGKYCRVSGSHNVTNRSNSSAVGSCKQSTSIPGAKNVKKGETKITGVVNRPYYDIFTKLVLFSNPPPLIPCRNIRTRNQAQRHGETRQTYVKKTEKYESYACIHPSTPKK